MGVVVGVVGCFAYFFVQNCCRWNSRSRQLFFLSFILQQAVGPGRLILLMSNYNYLSVGLNFLYSPKLYLAGGVLLYVSGKVSGYFGWKGAPEG